MIFISNQPDYLVRTTGTTTIQSVSFLYADITNTRLGINTTTPSNTLDVNGNIGASSDKFLFDGVSLNVGETSYSSLSLTPTLFPGDTSVIVGSTLQVEASKVKGTIITGETTAVSCVLGQLMYWDIGVGKWDKADADTDSATKLLGIVLNDAAADGEIALLIEGLMTTDQFTGTVRVGDALWVSTTAGDFSFAPPTAAGDYVRGVGWCIKSAGAYITVFFQPDITWLEL